MNLLRMECIGGASGDMILGALLDLGADADAVRNMLSSLPIESFELIVERLQLHQLAGTRVTVRVPHEHHAHRGLADIRRMIEQSRLPDRVKELSIHTFTRLAEAEARVHGTTPDRIHFHEVGAMDSIVDIVGSCAALDLLNVESVLLGPFPAGHGTIECAHGTIPSPAPATMELLKGFRTVQTDEPHELVTPTGAALLTSWPAATTPPGDVRISTVGYGFGHRTLDKLPNVLRAVLLQADSSTEGSSCLVLECSVDDTNPELLGALMPRLLEAGALDAYLTAVQMKKQRPGSLITVLCNPDARDRLLDLLFRETTTFGVREHAVNRTTLARRHEEAKTPYGTVRIKIGTWNGVDVTRAPEMEDCIRLARESQVAVRTVYEAAVAAAGTPSGKHA